MYIVETLHSYSQLGMYLSMKAVSSNTKKERMSGRGRERENKSLFTGWEIFLKIKTFSSLIFPLKYL